METIGTTELRSRLQDTVDRVRYTGERVVIAKHGKPAAAIVSTEDLELLQHLEDKADLKAVRAALKESGPRVPWSALKKELGL